ncbi:MAG TPA: serine/threonine protein kinase [Actinotalea sp.]|nr:serine/threonine protein kinase [Actinotalea sp.]
MSTDLLDGRYELGGLLGAGGSASVFRAQDVVAGTPVAIKLLHPHLARRPEAVAAFLAEARAAAGLDHDNVVRVLGAGRDGDLVWVAEDLVDGATLDEVVTASGPLAPAQALAVVAGVLAGLTHAHVRGVLHLDLSPGNVMVPWGADGPDLTRPQLLDLAGCPSGPRGGGTVRVSPCYASPEVATAGEVGAAADLYSTGALLFWLVTGRPPFEGPDPHAVLRAQVTAPPPVPSGLVRGLPADVDRIVARCLAKAPADRYPSATAMSLDVARARGALVLGPSAPGRTLELAVVAPGPRRAQRTTRPPGRFAATAMLAVAGALVTAVAVVAQPAWAPDAAAAGQAVVAATPTASSSPSPSAVAPTARVPDVVVPDVVGLGRVAATEALTAAGLVLAGTVLADGPGASDVVLGTEPAPGGVVAPGSAVTLVLASGLTLVPDVAGADVAAATAALAAAGLVAAPVGDPGGVLVAATEPQVGSRVLVGSTVGLLTRTPSPTPVPSGEPSPSAAPSPGPTATPAPTPTPGPTAVPNG